LTYIPLLFVQDFSFIRQWFLDLNLAGYLHAIPFLDENITLKNISSLFQVLLR